jgi:ribonuclease P protein component
MLHTRKRLRAHEVREIMAKGRSARAPHLSMKFLNTSQPFRAAAVVPKSLARKAVLRNRLRRALYRALASSPLAAKKISAVFFVRSIPRDALAPAFAHELGALASTI